MKSQYLLLALCSVVAGYQWSSVKIGGGGGFIPGIVFNPTEKGVAYSRADIGGAYKLNADDSWTALTDFANDETWHDWAVNAIATDPVVTSNLYLLVGAYTNSWDPKNGSVLRSTDYGSTWLPETVLPFKIGGNQPGRGAGERLVIDPHNNKILYLAAPSGHGLYKSVDMGATFSKVTSFPAVGDFEEDPTDTSGYSNDPIGLTTVVFDTTSAIKNGTTSRIFVGVASTKSSSLYVSEDAGVTWSAVVGQPTGRFPRRIKLSKHEKSLYLTYDNVAGPYDAGDGKVWRYNFTKGDGVWTDITPAWESQHSLTFGYGGISLDAKNPGVVVVAADNLWDPDVQIFRSNNSGATWTPLWDYVDGISLYYTQDTNNAPWITNSRDGDSKILGWMVESLEIDPFDSNHWLYGTGETLYGGHDLTSWPHVHLSSLADGIEETAVLGLAAPPGGPPLLSVVGDIGGFQHMSLTVSPNTSFQNPLYGTTDDIDYAGLKPKMIVRVGGTSGSTSSQLAVSQDSGSTWSPVTAASTSYAAGKVALSADGTAIVWVTSGSGVFRYVNGVQSAVSGLSSGVVIAADKVDPKYFYAADTTSAYVSSDGGATFKATAAVASYGASAIEVHPGVAGDVWLSATSAGLWHSTDFGSTFTKVGSVALSYAVALGRGAASAAYPNVYAFVTPNGASLNALHVSTDEGATWTQISDAGHGFGSSSSDVLTASQDVAGQVFVGTNGRGIFVGVPSHNATRI